ncbi:hypothetical protein DYH09_15590 [bacterium CPR1]|nr:hypothetical protein [bacterium CPR1]
MPARAGKFLAEMDLRPRDTSPEAEAVQLAVLRSLSGAQKVAICFELSEASREYTRSGIRSRHPEYCEHQVELALRRMTLGDDLFQKAWPDEPLLSP